MPSIPQSRDDLLRHLREQVGFLRASCRAVDEGNIAEGRRIAVTLRLLLHDTAKSSSLLSQLGMKGNPFFGTAGEILPGQLLTESSLLQLEICGGKGKYRAPLKDRPSFKFRWLNFDEWWSQPVFLDNKKRRLSRRDLVLSVADQDGGAHVDAELNEVYGDLSRRHSVDWKQVSFGKEEPVGPDVALLSLRQIGFEVLETLERYVPELKEDT
jgi:hypothetical protein